MIVGISTWDSMLDKCLETTAMSISGSGNWFSLGNDDKNYFMGYEAILWEYVEIADLILISIDWKSVAHYKNQFLRLLNIDTPTILWMEGEYNGFVNMPIVHKVDLVDTVKDNLVACSRTEYFYFSSVFDNVIILDERFDIKNMKSKHKNNVNQNIVLLPTSYAQDRYGEANAIIASKLDHQILMLRSREAYPMKYSDKITPVSWLQSSKYYDLLNRSLVCINTDVRYTLGKTAIDCACFKVPYISYGETCGSKVLWNIPIPLGATGEELLSATQDAINGKFESECTEAYNNVETFDKSIGREKILDYFNIEDF